MEPRSEDLEVKRYRCYLCSASSEERGLPLLSTKTSFSRVWLGVKLHEIVGDNFVVILSTKDAICWDCANCINKIDKYEMRLDEEKDRLMNCIQTKYKNKEIDLTGYYKHRDMERRLLQRNSDDSVHDIASSDHPDKDSDKKRFICPVCHRSFATAAAVGVHKARQHPTLFLCEKCDLPFTTEIKYRQHLLRHNLTTATKRRPANAKRLSCISCGFETTNTEAYCRHVCDSTIASMACTNCGRRFLSKKINGKHECMCTDCLKLEDEWSTVEGGESVEAASTAAANKTSTVAPTTTQLQSTPKEESLVDSTTDLADLDLVQPGETIIPADLNEEPPPPLLQSQEQQAMETTDGLTLIKCTNCDEVFEFSQVVTHPCFINGQTTEFAQVTAKHENEVAVVEAPSSSNPLVDPFLGLNDDVRSEVIISPSPPTVSSSNKQYRRRIPRIPAQENTFIPTVVDPTTRMICKTCGSEFRSIELMRQHWEITSHAPEIFTTTIELNKIRDKASKTEQTFKVVKQNFNIRANVIGQNDEDIRKQDETYYDCIVKIKDTPSIEEFNLQNGIPCETCDVVFGDAELLAEHQRTNCLTCVTCNVTFLDNKLLNKHYQYTGHATKKFKKQFTSLEMNDSTVATAFAVDDVQHVVINICEQCNLEFVDKDALQEHVLRFHNPLLVFNCDQCDAVFESAISRAEHVAEHSVHQAVLSESPHAPAENTRGVHRRRRRRKKKSNVQMYKTGSNYTCPRCNATLQTARAFAVHFRRHKTPYVCCRRRFRDTSLLAIHRRSVHSKSRPYRCPLCSSIYSVPAALTRHLTRQHRNAFLRPLYRCKVCRKLFGDPRKFNRHLLAHAKRNVGFIVLPPDGNVSAPLKWPGLEDISGKPPSFKKLGTLPLNATDEDILQAADTLIADGRIMLSEYSRDVRDVTDSDASNGNKVILTSEVIIENSDEFFDDL